MNWFLDLDGVILDTERFISDFKKLLLELGASKEAIDAYYCSQKTKYRSRTYYLIRHIETMRDTLGFRCIEEARCRIDGLIDGLPGYLFTDSIPFLETIQSDNVFLVTYGGRKLQELKISKTGIAKYFKEIAITDGGKKSDALIEFRRRGLIGGFDGIFIDDREKEILSIKKIFPEIIAVWLQRS